MKNANAAAKFTLNKTVVTRFASTSGSRSKGITDTSILTITNILTISVQ